MTDAYTKFYGVSMKGLRTATCIGFVLLAALFCVALVGCGASTPPKPALESDNPDLVLWPRADKAIHLRFSADRNLNSYDSIAHSIQVCVYQLDKPDAFLDRAKTAQGIAELLKAEAFDASVKNVVRLFAQPLETIACELDRAKDATFVGVVCGYFDATPENSAKLWEIKPKVTTSGIFWKSTTYSAGELDISLRLTSHAMVEDSGRTGKSQKETEKSQKKPEKSQKEPEKSQKESGGTP